jgi:hypothetical protein
VTAEGAAPRQLPAGLPLLGRGAHRDPAAGACLMEATALLAGEPQTDRPVSVHPVLAALARVVNDAVSDAARPALLAHAPTMIGTDAGGPDLTWALVELCCRTALPVALPIWAPRLRRDLRRAAAGKSFTSRQASRAVTLAAGSLVLATTGDDRDSILVELLTEAVCVAATSSAERGHLAPTEPVVVKPGRAVRG